MSNQRSRGYALLTMSFIVAALVIGAAVFAASYFERATTLTGTVIVGGSATVSSNVTDGLRLTATIYPINVPQGTNVTVTAQVNNTLSREVEANATSMADPAEGPCQQGLATGVRVYKGWDTPANLSKATELLLYNPSLVYLCPAVLAFQYSFAPDSDIATVQGILGGSRGSNTTGPVNETSILSGYWTGSGSQYAFQTFPQGSYTVVVFDAWGQTAIGHLQVALTSSSPVEVVSVTGPIPPYNPGGPVVSLSVKSISETPITSLDATISFVSASSTPYSFAFNVSSSNPLLPGQSTQTTRILIGAGFETGLNYPLTISGTFENGTQFFYAAQVQVVLPG
jgi:hypothetical protein